MKILDRYILGKYLTTFFFCLILFMVIVIVVDISEKTDDFVKSKLGVWQIFTDYYLGFIPRFAGMLFPLFIFISVIFFTSKMAGRSEIIAILSSGVSFARFCVPYVIGGLLLSLLLWFSTQTMIPKANYKWATFQKRYIDGNTAAGMLQSSYKQNIYFRMDSDSYMGIRGYDTVSKTGSGFYVQKFNGNKLVYNLRATSFSWDSARRQWNLSNVQERYFNETNEAVKSATSLSMKYNFKPVDLGKDDYLKDQMSTRELNDFISKEKQRGSEMLGTLLVERYNRDALPVSVFILTMIAVSMSSRKVRGGSGAHLAVGVVISVIYILLSRISVVFATKGNFSPFLAAWTPNLLFGLLAIYLFRRASK